MKRIGSFLLAILFSFSLFCADKNIHLYIQDMAQNPIREIEKGVPFLLQIVVENMNGIDEPESILGFENFQVTRYGSSQSTSIINGQRTDRIIFNFGLSAQKLGTFKIGPLSMQDAAGAEVKSGVVQVVVGDKTVAHSVKRQSFFLETQVNKKNLYVGEELLIKVRFYYINDVENLNIIRPKLEGFILANISSEPASGAEVIKGEEYHYQEWLITAYPEKTGTLIVPPVQAVFRSVSDFSQGFMGIFDMLGMSSEKTVQAAARSVDVVALPESRQYKNISAVGQFDQAVFALMQNKGDVGEGVIATFTVSGAANFPMIKAPELHLPAGLKYYESSSSVRALEESKQEKTFEYIIQAEQPGEFVIPSQQFIYFDSTEKKYNSLSTSETVLKINGDALVLKKSDDEETSDNPLSSSLNEGSNYVFKQDQIDYVLDSGFESYATNIFFGKVLSWLLAALIIFSCLILLLGLYSTYVGISWHETYWGYYFFVRWQLWKIARNQDMFAMYELFQQISNHYHLELQGEILADVLKKANLSDVKLQEFSQFLQSLLFLVFAKQQSIAKNKEQVLGQGKYWALELLKACRNISSDK